LVQAFKLVVKPKFSHLCKHVFVKFVWFTSSAFEDVT